MIRFVTLLLLGGFLSLASVSNGLKGYEGQPGHQGGGGQTGYEGQPGNQSNGSHGTSNGQRGYEGQPGNQGH